MKSLLKRTMLAAAPRWTTGLLSARARAHKHRLVREWRLDKITEKLLAALGPEVQSGPFQGMKLAGMSRQEIFGPFLLGTYEFQLHSWLAVVAARQYSQIIDVGSSFGYYAVGLARLFPQVPVVAFDTDWWARAACREMVRENRTSNVRVAGFCSPAWLDRNLQPDSLILCDCEGYEAELLAGSTTGALRSATIIVEMHDEMNPGVTEAILRRFLGTHEVETAVADPDHVPTPPVDLSFLTADEARSACREVRGHQTWIFLTPNSEVAAVTPSYGPTVPDAGKDPVVDPRP